MAEGNKYYQQLLNDDFESNDAFHTNRKSHIYGLSHLWSKDQRRHVCNALSNEANDYIIIKRIT